MAAPGQWVSPRRSGELWHDCRNLKRFTIDLDGLEHPARVVVRIGEHIFYIVYGANGHTNRFELVDNFFRAVLRAPI